MDLLKEIPARDSIEIIQQKIITDLQTKLKIN
jgi:hypothetical protein